jgi:hypothetical protein
MAQVSLPLGRWKMNAHGLATNLTIIAVNPDSTLQATLYGGAQVGCKQVQGFWDETAQNITFIQREDVPITTPIPPHHAVTDLLTYNGHLSQNVIAGVTQFTLEGFFSITILGGRSPQILLSWSAQFQNVSGPKGSHAHCGWLEDTVGVTSFQNNASFFNVIHPVFYTIDNPPDF